MMLKKNQYTVLIEMSEEYCINYSHLKSTKIALHILKKVIKELKDLQLIDYQRGLFDDDGMTCGSGWCLKYSNLELARKLIADYENANVQINKSGI